MTEIELIIKNTAVGVAKTGTLTAGMIGVPVRYQFDESWKGLTIVAVFKGGSVVRDRLLDDTMETTVPHECLAKPGVQLLIGAEGRNAAGDVVIPTVWGSVGLVRDGAQSSGDPGTDPENPLWAQLKGEVDLLKAEQPATEERFSDIEAVIASLPAVTKADEGKILQVVNGALVLVDAAESAVAAYVDGKFVPIAQADYEALEEAGTVDETKYYMIVGDSE